MKNVIIDYGMGNLRSVQKAIEFIGETAEITCDLEIIKSANRLILPGVGAFSHAIEKLEKSHLKEVIIDMVKNKNIPILGICLGMQLLYDQSQENGNFDGLGLIKGVVKKFNGNVEKVPQIGWNSLSTVNSKLTKDNSFVYFVHSYFAPINEFTATKTKYDGIEFTSTVEKDNIFATQYHPEKSGDEGLNIIKRFFEITKLEV